MPFNVNPDGQVRVAAAAVTVGAGSHCVPSASSVPTDGAQLYVVVAVALLEVPVGPVTKAVILVDPPRVGVPDAERLMETTGVRLCTPISTGVETAAR